MTLKRKLPLTLSLCVVGALLVTGCSREATGQVAAVVNGDEITLQEVNAEVSSLQLPPNVDRKVVQQTILQRLIERRLLAASAVADGVDKGPEYLMRKRQIDETLLVQLASEKTARAVRVPDQAAIDKFIASRPMMFAERTSYKIDRVQFPTPAEPAKLQAFAADHSMDAVIARLKAMGITYTRTATELDSAAVDAKTIARLRALPAGEPFLVPENGMISAGVIVAATPTPLTGDVARPIAIQVMRNEQVRSDLEARLKAARASAKIEYQAGFAPPKPANGAPAAGTAPKS